MSRLSREWSRLYGATHDLLEDQGRSRALVLELAGPAEWRPLSAVWQGAQADLGLPAPAVAVNGADGLQLWFSVTEPVHPAQADDFINGLCRRYLPDVPRTRLRRAPAHMPAQQGASGCWSAFLAPDLAVLFADTPWLDLPPNDDGQADLLASLASIRPAQFQAAAAQLQASTAVAAEAAGGRADPSGAADSAAARWFLLSVMNDAAVPLALRIEAAKALLTGERQRPG